MRGKDEQQLDVFSYVSPEQRVPQDHPLRPLRVMTEVALRELQPRFNKLYAKTGRPSIAPEKLLRALLLQALYSVRSERMLMEQLDYSLLFRWFVGLNMDDAAGSPRSPAGTHYAAKELAPIAVFATLPFTLVPAKTAFVSNNISCSVYIIPQPNIRI